VGRAFVYSPNSSRDSLRRAAVRELLEGYFDGSEEQLVRFLRGIEEHPPAPRRDAGERIDTVLL
jgi:predicted transcriptional regulator